MATKYFGCLVAACSFLIPVSGCAVGRISNEVAPDRNDEVRGITRRGSMAEILVGIVIVILLLLVVWLVKF